MGTVRNILSAVLNPFGFQIVKDSDWKRELRLGNKNPAFLRDDRFLAAYRRGVGSGHHFGGGRDPKMEWRTAVCCWAAMHARRLPGDFVECGTNTGILSLAVCDYIDFNSTGKRFYLFDTYEGIPTHQVVDGEDHERVDSMNANFYFDCYELARRNFSPYPNAILVKGLVPDSLASVEIGPVAYLSIDMNLAYPERAAIEYFWPKLVTGAVVVLDDYAFRRHEAQKAILDEFAGTQNVEIWSLPTGQGLLIKP